MPANDSLLFIDSNKYLDLYRIDKGKRLLAPLGEQIDYIFVTQQVVNEVQRNKILVAADFLKKKSKELKLQTFNLPDHLSSISIAQRNDILQKMSEIAQKIKDMNAEVDALVLGIMEQISRSEDEVSKAISPIFANAIPHAAKELQRARKRKELGNPPGKVTNPIGDQLTWEQILTHFKDKKRLWIISRDGDYGTVHSGKGFLNRFLYDELCKITPAPEVYLFEDIVEGINHFVDTTGVKAEQRLTPKEAEEIEREEKALPHLNESSESIRKMLQNMEQLNQPSKSLRKALGDMTLPGERIQKALENIGQFSQLNYEPSESLRKALGDMTLPGESVQKTLENIGQFSQLNYEPSESLRKALGDMTLPGESIQKTLENIGQFISQLNYKPSERVQEEINEKLQALPPSPEKNENDDENEEGETR